MTIYQREFERRLAAFNCMGELDEKRGILNVFMDSIPLCIIGKTGDIYWDGESLFSEERKEAIDEPCRLNRTIKEIVGLYELAPQMKADGVKSTDFSPNTEVSFSALCTANSTALCFLHRARIMTAVL